MKNNDKYALSVLIILVCSIIPISTHSLWGDEAWSITEYALEPTFKSLLTHLFQTVGGDSQFPGYNVYLWIWVHIFGSSEFSVRVANLPLFYLSILYTAFYLPRPKSFNIGLLLLISLSPIIWYYLNESRYIIVVFSCSLISLTSVILYFEGAAKHRNLAIFALFSSIILGIFFIMLYFFYLIPLFIIVLFYIKRQDTTLKSLIKDWRVAILISSVFIIVLGAYYYYTLKNGSGGMRLSPNIKNILFVFYDFLGFGGIGPPRNVLRANPTISDYSSYFIPLISAILFYIIILIILLRNFTKIKDKLPLFGFLGLIIGFSVFFLFAKVFDFKFLSRHLIFFLVPFLFSIYSLLYDILFFWSRKLVFSFIAVIFIIFLYSDMNIRFNPDYQKENYKKAVAFTLKESSNLPLLWIADEHCFQYYTQNKRLPDSRKIIYLSHSSNSSFFSLVTRIINKDVYFVVVLNRKDYTKRIHNLLLSESYLEISKDQDFSIYRYSPKPSIVE